MHTRHAHVVVLFAWLAAAATAGADPIALYAQNPRYFLFRGSPTVLVGSGEHYGAVLNPAFDYAGYLETLKRDGLNVTRLFVGTYLERSGDFGIALNNLAPAPGTALLPWARSAEPGFILGGNKFDLSRWDESYFVRLRDFVRRVFVAAEAGHREPEDSRVVLVEKPRELALIAGRKPSGEVEILWMFGHRLLDGSSAGNPSRRRIALIAPVSWAPEPHFKRHIAWDAGWTDTWRESPAWLVSTSPVSAS